MKKIVNLFVRYKEEESGNALILVALSMVMICGFVALVIDGGSLFFEKSKLQKSLDAAVLAGAQKLQTSQFQAEAVAIEVAQKNGITLNGSDIETGNDYIQVTKSVTKNLSFATVLGIPSADVAALAKAKVGGKLQRREGIVPVGIESEEFSTEAPYTMHFQPSNKENEPVSGNFGFLDIDTNNQSTLRDGIQDGVEMKISEEMHEWTNTGLKWGQVDQGFQHRINEDADEGRNYCSSYESADDSCERVVIVPIVESYEGSNGKTLVKIIGFASFWIQSVEQHEVVGRFINTVTFGEFSDVDDESTYGISGVKLVQ
ncbi:TadE/TadG family type IV pilus assembly protein [Thalassobacillus devorans]|uniref:TadE/TadG family type IV pilus assembly protein n=1 Tax=Thalassobacillus devorans TaxID=279813 RepID=UPI00048D7C47|nr:TadE/TadG family type IV pilus assembly protein [Thalassobacillus devorans]